MRRRDVGRRNYGFGIKFISWSLFWAYSAFILQSAIMTTTAPDLVSDKVLHLVAYFVLQVFGVNAFVRSKEKLLRRKAILFSFIWCFFLGTVTEASQIGIAYRHASWGDWLADILGGFLAAIITGFYLNSKKRELEDGLL